MGSCIGKRSKIIIRGLESKTNYVVNNIVLDRWTEPQVKLLSTRFNQYKTAQGLDKKGFAQIFPGVSHYPGLVVTSFFAEFDESSHGFINFRNFCVALAQILLANRDEKADFIFKIFDVDKDGYFKDTEYEMFIKSASENECLRYLSKIPAENINLHKVKLGQAPVSKEIFVEWALRNLELDLILRPFEIIPNPHTERDVIAKLLTEILEVGETVYLLSSDWWEVWKNYVNFEMEEINIEESNNEFMSISPANKQKMVALGDKPVAIDNSSLLIKEVKLKLRSSVKHKRDFVWLKPKAWESLILWYGGGPSIPRKVILERSKPVIELFPILLSVIPVSKYGHPLKEQRKSLLVSKAEKILLSLQNVSRMLNVLSQNSRFWILKDHTWELVKMDQTFEEANLNEDIEFMIETAIVDKTSIAWPRENIKDEEELKEGDRVQVKSGSNSNIDGIIINIKDDKITVKMAEKTESVSKSAVVSNRSKFNQLQNFVPGAVGLYNIGNTCYMNCIFQSLSHTPLLKNFLLSDASWELIQSAKDSDKGKIAIELSLLIRDIWGKRIPKLNPSKLIKTFTRIFTIFEGNQQHDCHEFLSLFMDRLHEDLIRIGEEVTNKTVVLENPLDKYAEIREADEQWRNLQGSQGSVITDLCGGQTRTTLRCANCKSKRVLFEIFTNLSLPIPIVMSIPIYITVIQTKTAITKIGLLISKYAQIDELITQISELTMIPKENIYLAELYMNSQLTHFDGHQNQILTRLGITSKSELFAYEIIRTIQEAEKLGRRVLSSIDISSEMKIGDQIDVETATHGWGTGRIKDIRQSNGSFEYLVNFDLEILKSEWVLQSQLAYFRTRTNADNPQTIQILLINSKLINGKRERIGFPIILSIGNWYTLADLHDIAIKSALKFFNRDYENEYRISRNISDFFQLVIIDPWSLTCGNCRKCSGCALPRSKAEVKVFGTKMQRIGIAADWTEKYFTCEPKDHQSVYDIRAKEEQLSQPIDISLCFNAFTEEEKVDSKCEKCGENAMKMHMEIWRSPDILVLSFKRFSYQDGCLEKIDQDVQFPIYAFDVSEWVKGIENTNGLTLSTTALLNAYDLYAVVFHTGGITGGHYTAVCQGSESEEHKWLLFDDEQVYEIVDGLEESFVMKNAYMLFYRRRKFSSSNVINLAYHCA